MKFFLFLFLLLSSAIFSQSFIERSYPGNYPTENYTGALDARSSYVGDRREQRFLSDELLKTVEREIFGGQLFKLDQFIKDLPLCPNATLAKNYNYMRYLYRLLSISYLYEGIKSYKSALYQLGLDHKQCSIDYKTIFSTCNPEDVEMKKFVFRVKKVWGRDFKLSQLNPLKKSQFERWFSSIERRKSYNLASMRVHKLGSRNLKKVEGTLLEGCSRGAELISLFCSEKDLLYGASDVPLLGDLILSSNAVRAIYSNDGTDFCFNRFSEHFSSRESKYHELQILVPIIFNNLNRKGAKYLEGSIFVPGALKEFDDLGLKDFLYVSKVKKKTKILKVEKKKKFVRKDLLPIVEVTIKKRVLTRKVRAEITKKEIVRKSAFQEALGKVASGDSRASVNMKKMKKDFIFSAEMLQKLKEPLAIYQTRAALEDMKTYDGLGTKSEPARLLFIKYLIDNNYHNGLYNMIAVLGKSFFVINDIENKNAPVLVELLNSKKTNFLWEIIILKGDESTSKAEKVIKKEEVLKKKILKKEVSRPLPKAKKKAKKKKKLRGKAIY